MDEEEERRAREKEIEDCSPFLYVLPRSFVRWFFKLFSVRFLDPFVLFVRSMFLVRVRLSALPVPSR
jgi:hypothetical protein